LYSMGLCSKMNSPRKNQLISMTIDGQTAQFIYDGNGNMVKKVKPDRSKTIYPYLVWH